MAKTMRKSKVKIRVFVEGDTEENYFKGLSRDLNLEIAIHPINMNGGGYKTFFKKVSGTTSLGCLAIFIIIDLDKMNNNNNTEIANFEKLLKYCRMKNKSKDNEIPHFLIGTYDDFEYFSCLHSTQYRGGNTDIFIVNNFKFRSVKDFKANKDIFKFLNSNGKSKETALNALRGRGVYLKNTIPNVKKIGMDIKIDRNTNIIENNNLRSVKNSNMNDFFDFISKLQNI